MWIRFSDLKIQVEDALQRRFRQAERIDCISRMAHDTKPAKKGMKRVFFHLIIVQEFWEIIEGLYAYTFGCRNVDI